MQNVLDRDYLQLMSKILSFGNVRNDRTNTGTLSVFGEFIYFPMDQGFPLLTSKFVSLKTVATELKWFLKGDTNIKYLVENGCNIWTGDAYKQYERVWNYDLDNPLSEKDFVERIKTDDEFARTWGNLGPIYGHQWRKKSQYGVQRDQLKMLIENIKQNPSSRRLMVNSWDVMNLHHMTLPPCHYNFQVWVNGDYMELMWNQRSADLFLGVPFNIASYGLLLHLLCFETGKIPGKLIGTFGDTHIYQNHFKQCYKQGMAETYPLPSIKILSSDILNGEFEYELTDYKYSPSIKAPLNT